MKRMNLLHELLLLVALCLSALPAGAQIESLRNKMGELYDNGYADSWFDREAAKSFIIGTYYASLNSTIDLDDMALTDEQKLWRSDQIAKLYESRSMRDDMIDLLIANLPDSCDEELLSNYAQNKDFHKIKTYRNIEEKILTLAGDSTVPAQVKELFHEPLNKLTKGKNKQPKPIAAQPCSESYLNTFASFWDKYENRSILEDAIQREGRHAAAKINIRINYNPSQRGSYASAYKATEKEVRNRKNKIEEYCRENSPVFWRNKFLEKGVTEEDMQAVTSPLSAQRLESIKQLDKHMTRHLSSNKQAILDSFISWYKKWRNDKDEDHSILTQEPPTQTASIEEIAGTNDRIYEKVQVSPKFPGEEKALMEWLSKNIIYPPICQEQGVQGRIYVSFIVNKDGSISNGKVLRSPHPAMSKEALRVLSKMPPWIPGMQDGEPVRVKFCLPILFRL